MKTKIILALITAICLMTAIRPYEAAARSDHKARVTANISGEVRHLGDGFGHSGAAGYQFNLGFEFGHFLVGLGQDKGYTLGGCSCGTSWTRAKAGYIIDAGRLSITPFLNAGLYTENERLGPCGNRFCFLAGNGLELGYAILEDKFDVNLQAQLLTTGYRVAGYSTGIGLTVKF